MSEHIDLDKVLKSIDENPGLEPVYLKEGSPCPRCGGALVVRNSERGEFLGCSNFPECSFVVRSKSHVINLRKLSVPCPRCGKELYVKRGRYGLYIGCDDYANCGFTDLKESTQISCPVCRKGKIRKLTTRQGRAFYACDNYPSCKFALNGEPVESPCSHCGFPLRYKKKVKAGIALKCANPLCPKKNARTYDFIERF